MNASTALATIQAELVNVGIGELHENLQRVVSRIDDLITDQHAANILAMWHVGELLAEIDNNPEKYLTEEQRSKHMSPSALLFQVFHKVYNADHFNNALRLYESYPSKPAIEGLINRRCPARPGWRVTASHVQLLLTIQDPEQRKVIEDKCAEEAYTTKALAVELNEILGIEKKKERGPAAPKGLKQRIYDLLEHQRKFITRSEKLWLEDEGLYTDIMNTSATKLTPTIRGYMTEIAENFDKLSTMIEEHQQLCKRINDNLAQMEQAENDAEDAESGDEEFEGDTWESGIKSEKRITR
jgi:predicted Rdx family selenoprotein